MSSTPSAGCHSGHQLTRADIPDWFRIDAEGRIWTSRNRGGYPSDTERRAEYRAKSGYLTVRWPGNTHPAHRVVFAWHFGETPAGALVRHVNDDRADNRPANLELGMNRDNMEDARRAGSFTGDHSRGERHYRTHLTEDDVRAMRLAYADGTTLKELAARYGVGKSNVSFIVNRKTWRHVT